MYLLRVKVSFTSILSKTSIYLYNRYNVIAFKKNSIYSYKIDLLNDIFGNNSREIFSLSLRPVPDNLKAVGFFLLFLFFKRKPA